MCKWPAHRKLTKGGARNAPHVSRQGRGRGRAKRTMRAPLYYMSALAAAGIEPAEHRW